MGYKGSPMIGKQLSWRSILEDDPAAVANFSLSWNEGSRASRAPTTSGSSMVFRGFAHGESGPRDFDRNWS